MRTLIIASVLAVTCTSAFACPDYIMSCYAAGQGRQTTTTCTTYRTADGSIVTRCTSN